MSGDVPLLPRCTRTGLTIPECSCRECTERLLSETLPPAQPAPSKVVTVLEPARRRARRRLAA